jgi:hypothetical protein
MLKEERNHIVIKAQPYTLQDGYILYKLGLDGILHQCLTTFKAYQVLSKMQKGLAKRCYGIHIYYENKINC